jgi:uncharacterized membrane protein YhiD involved in acid resistance
LIVDYRATQILVDIVPFLDGEGISPLTTARWQMRNSAIGIRIGASMALSAWRP